jgi:hypothetical protein
MEDCDDVLALLRPRLRPQPRPGEPATPLPPETDDNADILSALRRPKAKAAPAPKVHFARRSGQLMQHARATLELKRANEKTALEHQKRLKAEHDREVLLLESPSSASLVGARRRTRTMTERAQFTQRAALKPPVHDDKRQALAQHRSQSATSRGVHIAQHAWLKNVIFPPDVDSSVLPQAHRVFCYQHQFDEAMQRCKAMYKPERWRGLRSSAAPQSVKMFLQSGYIHLWESFWDGDSESYSSSPWLCRAIAMKEQNTQTIIEALLMRMALDIDNVDLFMARMSVLTLVIVQFGADRFAANKSALTWVMAALFWTISPKIWCHLEPCWSHGLTLVKGVAQNTKSVL